MRTRTTRTTMAAPSRSSSRRGVASLARRGPSSALSCCRPTSTTRGSSRCAPHPFASHPAVLPATRASPLPPPLQPASLPYERESQLQGLTARGASPSSSWLCRTPHCWVAPAPPFPPLLPPPLGLASLAGGGVAVANAMDLGDPLAPYGSVHPRNKTAVAARLGAAVGGERHSEGRSGTRALPQPYPQLPRPSRSSTSAPCPTSTPRTRPPSHTRRVRR